MHPIDTSNFFRENFMNMCRTTKVIANIGSYKQTNFCGLLKVQMQINNLNVYLYDNACIDNAYFTFKLLTCNLCSMSFVFRN